MTLLSPETCLAYADILEQPYRNVAGGVQHEPGEIARASAAALRICAARPGAVTCGAQPISDTIHPNYRWKCSRCDWLGVSQSDRPCNEVAK